MSEPIFDLTTERLYYRLPETYRVADAAQNWTLKKYLSGICGVEADLDLLMARFDRLDAAEMDAKAASVYANYQRQIFKVLRNNLLPNPAFRKTTGTATARRNYVLNPGMRSLGALTTVRTNECTNPQPNSVTGWSGLGGALVASSPWNPARSAYSLTGNGAATAYIFTASAARSWTAGTPVTVSATVQGPAGRWVEPYVHQTTGNAYLGGIHNPTVQLTGLPQRISATFVLAADVVAGDLNMAVAAYATNTQGVLANGDVVYVGDVLIEQGNTLQPYFDGGNVADTYYTYNWSGTANASSSRQQAYTLNNATSYLNLGGSGTSPFQSNAGVARVNSWGNTNKVGFTEGGMALAGNQRAYIRAKVKLDSSQANWNTTMQIIGRDDTNNDSNLYTLPANALLTVPADDQFHEISVDFFVPSGRTLQRLYIVPSVTAGNIDSGKGAEFKDFIVSAQPGPYFSGATPADSLLTYSWSGATDASYSSATGKAFGTDWAAGGAGTPSIVQGPLLDGGEQTADVRGTTYAYSAILPNTNVGEFYSAQATVRAIPGEYAAATTVQVRMHDGVGYIASGTPLTVTLPSDGSPLTIDCVSTAPVNSNQVRLYFYPSGGPIRVSKAIVDKVSAAGVSCGPYFDGNVPDYYMVQYDWTGIADQSTSTYSARTTLSTSDTDALGWARLGQTSDLVDPETADAAWLTWLAQMVGVDATRLVTDQERRDAVASASSGFHAGATQGVEDAVRSLLTGTRYVKVYDHSTAAGIGTGGQWDVLIVTRASETPSGTDVVGTVIRKGAKPAGITLYAKVYEDPWDTSDTLTWDQRDAMTWDQYEQYGV